MKRILAVTGTRADYGIYKPVFNALHTSPDIELSVAVVGMHLLPEFGSTVEEIRSDKFSIVAEIDSMTTEDTKLAMAQYVGKSEQAFADLFAKQKPDIVFVLGDRGEMLAAATAAVYLGIPVAQLHAGEHSGSVDDPVRHAITQLSSIHFCTTEHYAKEVKRMCPDAKHVVTVGAPALDTILSATFPSKEEIFAHYGFELGKPLLLFVQHPDTTDARIPSEQIQPSIDALSQFQGNILIIGSNADAGGMEMNTLLQKFAKKKDHSMFMINLPHVEFLSCERAADVLVGNSSSGIIEAASFNLPVVNIGNRQKGRLRSGNVEDVGYEAGAITAAVKRALKTESHYTNIYGDGKAASRIVEVFIGL